MLVDPDVRAAVHDSIRPTTGQATTSPYRSQPTIAARALMSTTHCDTGIIYNAVFGLVTMAIAVRLFKMDIR
jgi:hypothetical protein